MRLIFCFFSLFIGFIFSSKIQAATVFIEGSSVQILTDTIRVDTFVFDAVGFTSEITLDSFKSNPNYLINDSDLNQIKMHFGYNKILDFYTAFNKSAEYIGTKIKDSKNKHKPPSSLPCFISYKTEMESWFESRERKEVGVNLQETIIESEMISQLGQLVKIRNSFNNCLKTNYGNGNLTKNKRY